MSGPGVDRATFMAGVRAALGRDRGDTPAVPSAPPVDEGLLRRVGPDADLVPLFTTAATDAGMSVHVATAAALPEALPAILAQHECRRATVSVSDARMRDTAHRAVAAAGAAVVDWRAAPGLERHYDADIGITDVVGAIAETGSIVVSSHPARSRGSFLVPPVHVAIVPARDIVPDLIDFWDVWREAPPPAATVIITGPSKTADIEGILITGVHGPKAVEIVLVTDA